MGWAVLEGDGVKAPVYVGSGIFGVSRESREQFQQYRLRLLSFWVDQTEYLLSSYKPDEVINETIPAVGFNNSTQSYLANVAISAVQVIAMQASRPVKQIGANTVKKRIGGSKKATKVQVRNGVYEWLPLLRDRHKQWTQPKAMDEPDAIATGLVGLGYGIR